MTDPQPSAYRATADDWLNAETMAAHDSGNGYYALRCILELRAKVEALKARVSELQSCHNTTADHLLDIIAMVRGTFSTEAKPAPAGLPIMIPPANCRQRLQREGKPYPKSSCEACGPMSPLWLQCDAGLEVEAARPVAPPAAPAPAGGLVQELAFLIAGFASTAQLGDCAMSTAREVLRKMATWLEEQEDANPLLEVGDALNLLMEQEAVHHPQTEQSAAPARVNPIVEQVRQDLYFTTQRGARKAIREMATVGYSANPFNPVSEQAKHHGWLAAFAWLEQKASQ